MVGLQEDGQLQEGADMQHPVQPQEGGDVQPTYQLQEGGDVQHPGPVMLSHMWLVSYYYLLILIAFQYNKIAIDPEDNITTEDYLLMLLSNITN